MSRKSNGRDDVQELLGLGVRLGLAVLLAVLLELAGGSEGRGAGEELVRDVGLVDFAAGELGRGTVSRLRNTRCIIVWLPGRRPEPGQSRR